MRDAIEVVIQKLKSLGYWQRKVNYKMRDAAFSRQRYWGEPFPIIWKNGIAYPLDENELPWNCRMLKIINRDLKEKGLWQICLNGLAQKL